MVMSLILTDRLFQFLFIFYFLFICFCFLYFPFDMFFLSYFIFLFICFSFLYFPFDMFFFLIMLYFPFYLFFFWHFRLFTNFFSFLFLKKISAVSIYHSSHTTSFAHCFRAWDFSKYSFRIKEVPHNKCINKNKIEAWKFKNYYWLCITD